METENNSAVASRKLYVGSLPYSWSAEQLEELFTNYGRVTSAAIVSDQATKKSKGFGFVELENEEAAKKAMEELNGREIEGRNLAVREARPHVEPTRRPTQAVVATVTAVVGGDLLAR